jgi:hypothetical protein
MARPSATFRAERSANLPGPPATTLTRKKTRMAALVSFSRWMLFMAAEWMSRGRSQWNSGITA